MKWDLIGKQKLSTWMILKKMLKNKGKKAFFQWANYFSCFDIDGRCNSFGKNSLPTGTLKAQFHLLSSHMSSVQREDTSSCLPCQCIDVRALVCVSRGISHFVFYKKTRTALYECSLFIIITGSAFHLAETNHIQLFCVTFSLIALSIRHQSCPNT